MPSISIYAKRGLRMLKNLRLAIQAIYMAFKFNGYYNLDLFLAGIIAWWLNSVKNKIGIPSFIIWEAGDLEKADKINNENIDKMIKVFYNYNVDSNIDDTLNLLVKYFGNLWL